MIHDLVSYCDLMKNRVAIIVVYFGSLPGYFKAWWSSAIKNPDFDFLFYTDNKNVTSQGNIVVKHTTFIDFVNFIQKNYDFTIECSFPYKLCDFKPAYGDIFQEELKEYDFWGYCDIDIVYGNMKHFITDKLLESYEKILIDGHTSLYKNNERMRMLYRSQGRYPEYNFQEAFTTSDTCYFDEYRGMELKLIREHCSVFYKGDYYMNAMPQKPVFYDSYGKKVVGIWENGKLFCVDKKGNKLELLYFHISARKMKLISDENQQINKMYIVPGAFICNKSMPIEKLFLYKSGGVLYQWSWWMKRMRIQLKRYSIGRIVLLGIRKKQIEKLRRKLLLKHKQKGT